MGSGQELQSGPSFIPPTVETLDLLPRGLPASPGQQSGDGGKQQGDSSDEATGKRPRWRLSPVNRTESQAELYKDWLRILRFLRETRTTCYGTPVCIIATPGDLVLQSSHLQGKRTRGPRRASTLLTPQASTSWTRPRGGRAATIRSFSIRERMNKVTLF